MTSADQHRAAMVRRLLRRTTVSGQVRLPAVPSLLEEIQALCEDLWEAFGIQFDPEQQEHLRGVLADQLAQAYAASPRAEIVIAYEAPVGFTVSYTVTTQLKALAQAYDQWVETRQPPYFGLAADARVMALVSDAAVPASCPVLDIGAGTGRNALALARRGHPVDAVELSAQFAAILRQEAQQQSLPVEVIERDVFSSQHDLRHDYGLVVLSEVTSDFRSIAELRQMFELAAQCLAPGGFLVFNVFLPRLGYAPDAAARELGLQVYTSMFSYPEVSAAVSGLPLDLLADDSVYAYERGHLPQGAWPPTGWYADWVSGLDVFDVPREESPIEMRWLVYRKAIPRPSVAVRQ